MVEGQQECMAYGCTNPAVWVVDAETPTILCEDCREKLDSGMIVIIKEGTVVDIENKPPAV